MNPYAKAADQYLTQKVMGASPVQMVVILLERAERELGVAVQALGRKDYEAKGNAVNRVGSILEELMLMLSLDTGGEAAADLMQLYVWWTREVFEASETREAERMEGVARQMADVRAAWQQADLKAKAEPKGPGLQGGELLG